MKKLFKKLMNLLGRFSNKTFIYLPKERSKNLLTAVKSKYGFWYVGNITDQSDSAYGVLCNGDIEREETSLVIKILDNLSDNFCAYDIGSNTGWYSLVFASHKKNNNVFSFEPINEHIELQKHSLHINRFEDKVTVISEALSNKEGEDIIHLAGSGTSIGGEFLKSELGTRVIQITTMDTLFTSKRISKPDFIKIDVEGHEHCVLQGAEKTLTSCTPVLFIEMAKTFKAADFISVSFEKNIFFLEKLGYIGYGLYGNRLCKIDKDSIPDGVYMYLFLHKEKHKNLFNVLGL